MKKILIILGKITLIETITTSLVACNTPRQYNEKQLKELKEKNNIRTKYGILEGIASQEKPFNQVNNKYYFVVGRINENNDGRIIKFKHSDLQKKVLDKYYNYDLKMEEKDLLVYENKFPYRTGSGRLNISGRNFKFVYSGNNNINIPNLIINSKTGKVKVE